MTVLRPPLAFDPAETLLSFANRLSFFHTGMGMSRLLEDIGIKASSFISGHPHVVENLAIATGEEPALFLDNLIAVSQRSVSFRGEDFNKGFLSPRASKFCPSCLIEDGAAQDWRHRLIWGFRHVHRCQVHNEMLLSLDDAQAVSLQENLEDVAGLRRVSDEGDRPDYLHWLEKRLKRSESDNNLWLQDQTIEEILNASEMLGAVLEHGHHVRLKSLSANELEQVTDIGFSIVSEGPDAVTEALDTIRQTSGAKAVQAGPLAHYGRLFDWLDRRANLIDPGPIKTLLRDHIVKHSAVEPGTTVLGVEIMERRYHTVQSLASELGFDRKKMSRLLQKLDLVPQGATDAESGKLVFEAKKTRALIDAFRTAIPMRDVPEYIGATKSQFEALYRSGTVLPLVPSTGRGSVRNVIFGRSDLDHFLARIDRIPEVPKTPIGDIQPLTYACQHGAGALEKLMPDIVSGKVICYRNSDRQGVAQIMVDMTSFQRV